MSASRDWISRVEALNFIKVKVGLADPSDLLDAAIARGDIRCIEKPAVEPPLIATHQAIMGGIDISSGGITWVDRNYDDPSYPKVSFGDLRRYANWFLKGRDRKTTTSHKGGRPGGWDWEALEEALRNEVAVRDFPDKLNVPGWRTQTDVIRWLKDRMERDPTNKGHLPSESTLKRQASQMMVKIARIKT
jgi:hypothetical protein